jgi:putative copper export protein
MAHWVGLDVVVGVLIVAGLIVAVVLIRTSNAAVTIRTYFDAAILMVLTLAILVAAAIRRLPSNFPEDSGSDDRSDGPSHLSDAS